MVALPIAVTPPAHALDENRVVTSFGGSSGWADPVTWPCPTAGAGPSAGTLVSGPGTPPLGSGSLQLQAAPNQQLELQLMMPRNPTGMTDFTVDAYGSGTWAARVLAYIPAATTGGAPTWLYDYVTYPSSGLSWSTVNLLTSVWYRFPYGSPNYDGSGSLTSLLGTGLPSGAVINISFMAVGCNLATAQTVHLDKVIIGYDGNRQITDFDPPPAPAPAAATVTAKPAKKVVKAGGKVVVKGTTTPARSGVKATLWRAGKKPKSLASATVDNGSFKIAKKLKKKGKYQLYVTIDADATTQSATSSTFRVRVK
ncbi:hypothetical protein [Nocardioides sp.]|uniref:hypothetical protein n=1 Tax=Nocardioides sp. TaxID=35761 RepID=UPI0039E4846A